MKKERSVVEEEKSLNRSGLFNKVMLGNGNAMKFDKHEFETTETLDKAHTGIVWRIARISDTEFATVSNDKSVKVWSTFSKAPKYTIEVGIAVNSVTCVSREDKPLYLVIGTYSGSLGLIDLEKKALVDKQEKAHSQYCSCVIQLMQTEELTVCSLSCDKVVVWQVMNG